MLGEKSLVLAAGMRLQYRAVRCAADCFQKVFVMGTPEARPLRLSAACAGFTPAGVSAGDIGSLAVDAVADACARLKIDVVLPSDGETTRWLAQNHAALPARCFPTPTVPVFDMLDDKHRFGELCGRIGIPTPPMMLMEDAQQAAAAIRAGVVRLPAVVKPLRLWGSSGVARIDHANAAQVLAAVNYAPVLIQQFIDGRDLSVFLVCRAGVASAAVVYQRSRESVDFIRHDGLVALAQRIAEHVGFDGVVGFDVREQPDGALFFLECNPRFWYSMDAARRGGLNFVALGLEDAPPVKMRVLHDVRVPQPRALLRPLPWKPDMALARLGRECAADLAVHVAMAMHSAFGGARGQAA